MILFQNQLTSADVTMKQKEDTPNAQPGVEEMRWGRAPMSSRIATSVVCTV